MPVADSETKTVLVTDAGRGSSIAVIRAFGRKGWRVIAADSDHRSPGFQSRYVSDHLVYPSPTTKAHDFIETLMIAVKGMGVDLIVPVTDETILPLVGERDQFEELCQLAIAPGPSLKATLDKCETIGLAERLNVPVPETRLVHTVEEARRQTLDLTWPIVLKPSISRRYLQEDGVIQKFSVSYANDLNTLSEQMKQLEDQCPVLLQEYCPGAGHGVEMLAWQGRLIAAFQHRRLCEYPPSGGASAFRESVALDPQLLDYASRLVEALNWTGLIMVEFKVSERTVQLMEINGRIWGSMPLAVASGMDFPGLLADLYENGGSGHKQSLFKDYQVGIRAVNPNLMLLWLGRVLLGRRDYDYLSFPTRKQGVSALIQLLNPRVKFDIFSLNDPKPGLAEAARLGRKSLSNFIKQV